MAIAFGSLLADLSSATDATSYTTASFTPEANALVIAAVQWERTPINAAGAISGGGLTWSAIQDQTNYSSIAAPTFALAWFWALAPGAPSSMTVTLDFSGETQTGCEIQVFSFTGTHATSPIVQAKTNRTNTGADLSAVLDSALQSGSATVAIAGTAANNAITPRASWTEIGDNGHASPAARLETQYRLATSETTGSCDPPSTPAIAIIVVEVAIAASAHTVAVNQVTETDAAQAMTHRKARLLGQPSETDAAQTIAWAPKHRLVALAAETDVAQAVTSVKRLGVNQTTETDAAQAVAWAPKHQLVAFVGEADLAQPVARVTALGIGQAAESDVAQAIARLKVRVVAQALETDLAQSITEGGAQLVVVGQVSETDVAHAIAWAPKHRLIALVSETDVAQAVARLKLQAIAQAVELDVAQPLTRRKAILLAQVVEVDVAHAMGRRKTVPIIQVVEVDLAQPITAIGGASVAALFIGPITLLRADVGAVTLLRADVGAVAWEG